MAKNPAGTVVNLPPKVDSQDSLPQVVVAKEREPINISWKDINAFTANRKRFIFFGKSKSTQFLHDVCGKVKSGQLLAILGENGSGKTTLLNVLAGRNLHNMFVSGEIRLNERLINEKKMKLYSSYAQKETKFLQTLTVNEHLYYQTKFRRPNNWTNLQVETRYAYLVNQLNLTDCLNTVIGDSKITNFKVNGITEAERKRLAIASELIGDPSLLFLDEPTSGLNSNMATKLVEILRQYATIENRTIICTFNSPSSTTFALFDYILLLSNGKVAFMGDPNSASEFFANNGYQLPANFNPIDFYIDALSPKGDETRKKSRLRIQTICEAFKNTNEYQRITSKIDVPKTDPQLPNIEKMPTDAKIRENAKPEWITQFRAIFYRSSTNMMREPTIRIEIVITIISSLVFGLVFYQQKFNQVGIFNLNGALFILVLVLLYANFAPALKIFNDELPMFYREHDDGLYTITAYFTAKNLAELPLFTVIPLIFTTIFYYLAGLNNNSTKIINCLIISAIIANCSVSIAYLIATITSSKKYSTIIARPIMALMFIFSGYIINTSSLSSYIDWCKYFSFLYFGNKLLFINQWSNVTDIVCTAEYDHCILTGEKVLKMYSFENKNFIINIFFLVCLLIFYRLIAFSILYVKSVIHSQKK